MDRRKFILETSLATAGLSLLNASSWAKGLFATNTANPVHNIPADKKLNPEWLKSLYARGKPTMYSKTKNEFRYIGMPVGGLHSGTVYVGGDGRLWLWEIYNSAEEGVDPKEVVWNNGIRESKLRNRDGANFIEPATADNKRFLEQGFAIKLNDRGKTIIKRLQEEDWSEIIFEATFPQATIRYIDNDFPLEVIINIGPVFIPLDAENSALPATIYEIDIRNKTIHPLDFSLCGWLENGSGKILAKDGDGKRINKAHKDTSYLNITGSFDAVKENVRQQRDYGSTAITLIGAKGEINTNAQIWPVNQDTFTTPNEEISQCAPSEKLIGSITYHDTIQPSGNLKVNYIISWHFDHPLAHRLDKLPETKGSYYYGAKYKDAAAVGAYIAQNFDYLSHNTNLWKQTFYDSTLPYWFLERAFVNISTLNTANTYRFSDGRFWSWEGVNACEGTCTHVWHYAQAMARIFPELERDCRQRTDYHIALFPDGGISFRAEYETQPAIDGQAGCVLRTYREHQMSADNTFLTLNWPEVKKAILFIMAQDKNDDGMTDTPMENTLDAVWQGEISWIVGLSIAAIKAGQLMAEEMGDLEFAAKCSNYVEKGAKNMERQLFNGEYFIHKPNPEYGKKTLGSYNTCHIDQVLGQGWAFQTGLGRLWDKEKTFSALRALWKYNFAPDVGPYIKTHVGGRPFAMEGEAGLIMNTNPHNEKNPYGEEIDSWQIGYFHECMTGFEHQVAAHMMAEGMLEEALVITRSIHDRYHAAKRNPFNEIECSDHYSRAMSSYGTFITACGFEYHGPKGFIRFAPKWNKENFRAPFTTAKGWGTYSQTSTSDKQQHHFELKYGSLQLQEISLEKSNAGQIKKVRVTKGVKPMAASYHRHDNTILIKMNESLVIEPGQPLHIYII